MNWFNRLTPKISLFISLLSFAIGTTLALVKVPGMWYIPLILSIPTVLIFIFTIQRWTVIPLRGPRFLNEDTAYQILGEAVYMNPKENPICWHLTIMHANGIAIASKLAETILCTIKHLQKIILGRSGNMQREGISTVSKIRIHLDRLRRIDAIITGVVTEENTTTKSYRNIQEGNNVYKLLKEGRDLLRENILDIMDNFCDKVPLEVNEELVKFHLLSRDDSELSKEAGEWRDSINKLMVQNVPAELTKIVNDKLIEADKLASSILDKLRKDWFTDLRFIWSDSICRPDLST